MSNIYLSGSTIRIKATFTDFDNIKIDPDLVKIIFYDDKYTKKSEFVLGEDNRLELGVYYFDYTLPSESYNNKKFYYEFYGEYHGKIFLNRESFLVKFCN